MGKIPLIYKILIFIGILWCSDKVWALLWSFGAGKILLIFFSITAFFGMIKTFSGSRRNTY